MFIDADRHGVPRIVGKGEGEGLLRAPTRTSPPSASSSSAGQRERTLELAEVPARRVLRHDARGRRSRTALERRGMAFNGAVLVSSCLNAYDDFNGPPFAIDRAYELYLPTMAATAWYHKKLDPRPADLAAFVGEVRAVRARRIRAGARSKGDKLDAGDARTRSPRSSTASPACRRRTSVNAEPAHRPETASRRSCCGASGGPSDGWTRRYRASTTTPPASRRSTTPADARSAPAFVAAFNNYVRDDARATRPRTSTSPTNYDEVGQGLGRPPPRRRREVRRCPTSRRTCATRCPRTRA